ncbi:MAG: hypothetical protein OEV00_10925, partial [Acidobacteriota bacterium]|nr:hypothetical protein [Acidobacteriota bacterium]
FVEAALGTRLTRDAATSQDTTLAELRLRLETEWNTERSRWVAKGEGLYDDVTETWEFQLRELATTLTPTESLDLRIGRQVLTWGTGDLVFLNDLFAKDFESFFSGRRDDYLKAPENAVRLLRYGRHVDLDIVWAPIFQPDVYLDGERFSFFSPQAGAIVAPQPALLARRPPRTLDNGELSIRLSREKAGVETAVYLHRGFFQQPLALDSDGTPTFAPLRALGASVRRSAWGGLVSGEFVYYDSIDDRRGTKPEIPNGQVRGLLGFERELARSLNAGFQYYVEWTLDHDDLLAASLEPSFEPDEVRHLLTHRLTYRMWQDRLQLSAFLFFSPSDRDGYLRCEAAYRIDDRWNVALGFGLFSGRDDHTFFGQLDHNDNLFMRARYSF